MSSKVIAVAGAGTGISLSVAEKFGKQGYKVALLSRTKSNLDGLAAGLKAKGIEAESFPVDLGVASAVKAAFAAVAEKLGPVTVLHWNAYAGSVSGPLLDLSEESLNTLHNVSLTGLITSVQAVAPGMEGQEGAAILFTNGGLYKFDEGISRFAVSIGAGGLGYVNAAKHKIAGVLNVELGPKGIFVGEVSVNEVVKGTAWDQGTATLEASTVADKFWEVYTTRSPVYVDVP